MSDVAVAADYYRMPSLGADMERGIVLEWFVRPGDEVHRGDIVALIDTEKAEIEAEIFANGVIGEYLVPIGEAVPIGTPLATVLPLGAPATVTAPGTPAAISAPGTPETIPPPGAAPTIPPPGVPPVLPIASSAAASRPIGTPGPQPTILSPSSAPPVVRPRVEGSPAAVREVPRSSPRARRLATERGIELARISGSGPGGAVLAVDLHDAAVQRSAPVQAADNPRRVIARLMTRSKREIPHYYLALDIDLGEALSWLTETNLTRPVAQRVLPAALLLRATALAAVALPPLNGFWVEDRFQPGDAVNLGVAISTRGRGGRPGGLVAPAILSAERLGVEATMAALRDLVRRARTGGLRSSEMSAPTITVTNLGDSGASEVFGVIYPPQVAMVGFGRITERAWVKDGTVSARPLVTATLAADHRATDGHVGARFLAAVAHHLAKPERLLVGEESGPPGDVDRETDDANERHATKHDANARRRNAGAGPARSSDGQDREVQ